ncbi:hypothetical protein BJX64DRAFT_286142 [Aspergillus heterothallicus]
MNGRVSFVSLEYVFPVFNVNEEPVLCNRLKVDIAEAVGVSDGAARLARERKGMQAGKVFGSQNISHNQQYLGRRRVDPDYVRTLEDQIAVLRDELAQAKAPNKDSPQDNDDGGTRDDHASVAILPSMSTAIEDFKNKANGRPIIDTAAAPNIKALRSNKVDMQAVTGHLLDLFAHYINPINQFVDRETLDQIRGDNLSPGLQLIKTAALAALALYTDDPHRKTLGGEAAAIVDATALQLCRQSPDTSIIQTLSIMRLAGAGIRAA